MASESELEKIAKEASDLERAILRLCQESDYPDSVINALMDSLCVIAKRLNLNPLNLIKAFALYISSIASVESNESIEKFLKEFHGKIISIKW